MTPEQALQHLFGLSELAAAPKQAHAIAQKAHEVLSEAIKPKEETKKK
jgi:hypothetical protein